MTVDDLDYLVQDDSQDDAGEPESFEQVKKVMDHFFPFLLLPKARVAMMNAAARIQKTAIAKA
jgi:hypothetical protein